MPSVCGIRVTTIGVEFGRWGGRVKGGGAQSPPHDYTHGKVGSPTGGQGLPFLKRVPHVPTWGECPTVSISWNPGSNPTGQIL